MILVSRRMWVVMYDVHAGSMLSFSHACATRSILSFDERQEDIRTAICRSHWWHLAHSP